MIKSIKFNGKSGYIISKIKEPECCVRGYGSYPLSRFNDKEKEYIAEYEKAHKEWEKHKDEYNNPHLVENLIGRKILFEDNKINLIFGPNGSGKSTIIKAIAGNAGCKDGFTTLAEPLDIGGFKLDHKASKRDFRAYLDGLMKNTADIEWDGTPIYYDNFASKKSVVIGDLGGSLLGDNLVDEVEYLWNKDKISKGQETIYLYTKLLGIAKNKTCFGEMFKDYLTEDGKVDINFLKKQFNDTWANVFALQLNYYMGMEKSNIKSSCTFLLDEIDKSLDINNIYELYYNQLPYIVKELGLQIIIISHSPMVLSDKIRNNEAYNFISIDEEYTNECLNKIKKLF